MTNARRAGVLAMALLAGLVVAQPALAALGDRTLRKGSRGRDVASLQRILTKLDFRTEADGVFGSGTERNVKRYERRRRYRIDGAVSCVQAHRMSRQARALGTRRRPAYRLGDRTLRRGKRGPDVKRLQAVLTLLGQSTAADGSFGPGTERRVRSYERRKGYAVNGVVGCRQAHRMRRQARNAAGAPDGATAAGHVFPVRGPHSFGSSGSRFGAPRSGHIHKGQDVAAASGTPLVAVFKGVVSWRAYQASGAGNYLVLRADDGTDYVYMHLRRPALVAKGQRVAAGQTVGHVGCTGSCSGPHLHFEAWTPHWWDGGRPFDPLPLLQRWDAAS